MKLSAKDKIFTTAVFCLIGAASVLLYQELTARVETTGLRKIGTVTYRYKKAERKYKKQVIWEGIDQHEPVYNYDSIRTVEGATARIRLSDGSVIDLEENTLVLLSMKGKAVNIGFEKGNLFTDSSRGGGDVSVSSKNTRVETRGGKLTLSRKGDRLAVDVSSGMATLKGKKGSRKIDAGMTALVAREGLSVRKIPYRITSPAPGTFYITEKAWYPVIFRWKSDGSETVLEVSTSPSFKKLKFARKTTAQQLKRGLVPGVYYWRLRSASDKNRVSSAAKLILVRDSAPVITTPKKTGYYSYFSKRPSVNIVWKRSAAATSYRVEVARDAGFKKIIATETTSGISYKYTPPGKGRFYCRVTSLYSFSSSSFSSPPVQLLVKKTARYRAPELVTPRSGKQVSLRGLFNKGIFLNWQADGEASRYEVQISRDRNFKTIKHRHDTVTNFVTLKEKLSNGTWYWRVRGIGDGGEKFPPTKASRFVVVDSVAITPLSPASGASFSSMGKTIAFSWRDPDGTGRYRVDVMKMPGDKKGFISKRSGSTRITLGGVPAGKFYWKVSRIGGGGKIVTSTKPRLFIVQGNLARPEIVFPRQNSTINVRFKRNIHFRWKPVRGATHYEVEVYRYKGFFNRRLFSRRLKGTDFFLKDFSLLDIDTFYWEVHALRVEGGAVTARSGGKKNYFAVSLGGVEPEKIKITSPKVIYVD